jgi:hypothetical protein
MTTRVMAALLSLSLLAAACGSNEKSAFERYCDAGTDLRSAVDELVSTNPLDGGLDGFSEKIDNVTSAANDMRTYASETAADEIDALTSALSTLGTLALDIGVEPGVDDVTRIDDLVKALGDLGTASKAVYDTLTAC